LFVWGMATRADRDLLLLKTVAVVLGWPQSLEVARRKSLVN
jgi:hypothetical protein